MQCPVCGAYVTDKDRFCGECGEALAPPAEPAPEPAAAEPSWIEQIDLPMQDQGPTTSRRRLPVIVAGLVSLLVCALVGGWGLFRGLTSQDTAPPVTPPAAEPLGTVGEVLQEDRFDDPNSGWDIYTVDQGSVGYDDGAYRIVVQATEYDVWATSNWGLALADFVIEVDARRVEGPLDNDYGVLVRYQPDDDNFILFAISSDGSYTVQTFRDREWGLLVDWTETDAVRDPAATNRLRVECLGSRMRFVVNGTPLAEVEDAAFDSGDVGLLAGAFDQGGVVIAFDNLQVRALTP
jgi:hypothetical protein